jgi:DNA-binding SARP family transcriptional activator/tetratricopeptide (TPR) repeat protein
MNGVTLATDGSVAQVASSIRDRRLAAGLTQREVAAVAGVSVGVIRDLEQGVTLRPRPQLLQRLATLLGTEARASGPPAAALGERGSFWCGILGPLEARGPEGEIQPVGPRQRAVLGLLATCPNAVVDRETIIDALWREDPPLTAVTMIQSYVSQLRRMLPRDQGTGRTALATAGSGYRLCLGDDELDLMVFSRLTARARKARQAGERATAFGAFEMALELWRGEPLADVNLLSGHPAVTALRALRGATVIDYAETASTQADHDKAVPHLRAMAAREPLNERAHGCLMMALAAIGQPAAALKVFEDVRRRLDGELGVQPGAELAEAHLRVLRGTVRVAGRVDPEQAPDGNAVPATPVMAVMPVPCQLPAAVSDFTGRAAEIAHLARILASDESGAGVGVPVAAISGLPGSGKTAVALRAAHQLRPAFPDGQLWIQLDGASARPRQPAEVLGELLRTLGVHGAAIPDTLAEKAAMYRSRLADRRVLLVADDAGSADQVRPLIPGTAGSAIIVTSRAQLTELPGARVIPLGLLGSADAVGLLARIVGDDRVSAEPQHAEQLVAACGRLPLALRIAGAKLAGRPAWPVSLMSEALADHKRRLDELAAGSLSVRASLAVSYQTLDDQSQRALCFLGMLGPTDVAGWVVGALLGVADASEVVNKLADSSLLTPAGPDATGQPRYRLHDLLRDYAVERLDSEHGGERDAALARALAAWLQLACIADSGLLREPYFPPPSDGDAPGGIPEALARRLTADPVAWFSAERLNLLAAGEHSCAAGNYRLAAQLAARVAAYQHVQSRPDDTGSMWHAILNAARAADDSVAAAHAELRLAVATCERGRHADAAPAIDRCVAAFEEHGDNRALAAALYWRASCEMNLGSFRDGQVTAMRSLALARTLAERQTEFLALRMLALTQGNLPDYREEAIRSSEQALAVVREFDQPAWELEVMHSVAHVANLTGRHQEAINLCHEAHDLQGKFGVNFDEADWLGIMADAHHGLGRYREAAEALSMAFPIFRDQFMRRHQALCLLKLGYAYQAMGDYGQAITSARESLPIFRELRLAQYEKQVFQTIANCERRLKLTTLPLPPHS